MYHAHYFAPCVPFCTSVDPLLGRLEYSVMSQQALMELLIAGIEKIDDICGSRDEPTDLCEWPGVKYRKRRDEVVEVAWSSLRLGGSLDMQWLPQTVVHFCASYNGLIGSSDLEKLPHGLKNFNLGVNNLSGTVRLHAVPKSLVRLNLKCNKLSGSVDLSGLPIGLKHVILYRNELCGSLDLTSLPPQIATLSLDANKFTGSVDFGSLPDSLLLLDISDNDLSGGGAVTKAFAKRIKKGYTNIKFKYVNK
ncbi:leucine-rich repeat protein [Perkinsela sp. CCAP 1560/4]|nr:leucine-rich repeat protein [Perkinsela sp. CCAP 1560/4]|eukprot:KNH08045.1 leucine-rich repeat protein [Perkinsela sp. CCAP 1560/4]